MILALVNQVVLFFLVPNKIVIGGWIQLSLLNNSNVKIPNKDIRSSEMCLTYGFIYHMAWTVEFIQTTKSIHLHCLTFLIYKREPRFFLYTHIIPSWLINKAEVNPTDKWVVNRCELLFDKNWSIFTSVWFYTCISPVLLQCNSS